MYPCAEFCYALRACGSVSICTWLFIHVHEAMFSPAPGRVSMWSCVNIQEVCLSACRIWLCTIVHVAIYPQISLRALGHSAEFCYALWATAQYLFCSGPQSRILISAMDYSAEFCDASWTTEQSFVKRYGRRAYD